MRWTHGRQHGETEDTGEVTTVHTASYTVSQGTTTIRPDGACAGRGRRWVPPRAKRPRGSRFTARPGRRRAAASRPPTRTRAETRAHHWRHVYGMYMDTWTVDVRRSPYSWSTWRADTCRHCSCLLPVPPHATVYCVYARIRDFGFNIYALYMHNALCFLWIIWNAQ